MWIVALNLGGVGHRLSEVSGYRAEMKSFFFKDAGGRTYRLEQVRDGDLLVFRVRTSGFSTIGYANCLGCSREDMELSDLVVHEDVRPNCKIWPLNLIFQARPRSFQGLGIGSALLDRILKIAKIEGYCRVTAKIHSRDLRDKPWLPNWYRRFGFSATRTVDGYVIERCF